MRAKPSSPKSKNGLKIGRLEKPKEPHLSNAYIRSLVKQLVSSRTKKPLSSCENASPEKENVTGNNSCDEISEKFHKKQVRRRLHNTRPYEHKLLNMAEARKEIVTALKSHRASMKQQCSESSSRRIHPEQNPSFSANSLQHFSYSQGFCSPYVWPVSSMVQPPSFFQENFSFPLPSQTLGLNLNLEDFANMSNVNSSSVYSSSPFPVISSYVETPPMPVVHSGGFGLQAGDEKVDDCDMDSPFDEEVKFPAWLSLNESFLGDHCSDYYVQDSSLSCMKIEEEIEGMDGDWLI